MIAFPPYLAPSSVQREGDKTGTGYFSDPWILWFNSISKAINDDIVSEVGGGVGVGLVDLASGVSGILGILNGGNGSSTPGLVAGTNISLTGSWPNQTISASGVVTNFSGALALNQIVLGNGLSDVKNLGSLGGVHTVLHGNAGGVPSWGAIDLTADVTGILPIVGGGNGTASPGLVAGTNISLTGTWPTQTVSASGVVTNVTGSGNIASSGGTTPNITFTGILPIASGGNGSSSPGIVAGSNITVTGAWPTQTVAATGVGGGTVTNIGGPLTLGHVMLGAGGSDSKVDSVAFSDGAGLLTANGFQPLLYGGVFTTGMYMYPANVLQWTTGGNLNMSLNDAGALSVGPQSGTTSSGIAHAWGGGVAGIELGVNGGVGFIGGAGGRIFLSDNAFYDAGGYNRVSGVIPTNIFNVFGASGFVWYSDPTGAAGNYTPTPVMQLDTSGHLGIGRAPISALDVSASQGIITINSTVSTNGTRLDIQNAGVRNGMLGAVAAAGAMCANSVPGDVVLRSRAGALLFTVDDGVTTHVKLDSTGKLGIGTVSPLTKLETYAASSSIQVLSSVRNDNTGSPVAAIGFNVSASGAAETSVTKAGIGQLRTTAQGVGPLIFYNRISTDTSSFVAGDERMRIDASGNVLVTSPGGLGYGTGAGGSVSQLTSKSTAVTLNKPCGRIITNNQLMSIGNRIGFVLNNSLIAATDVVVVAPSGFLDYRADAFNVGAGSVSIDLIKQTGVSSSDAVVINFAIIKAVIA